MRKSQNKLWQHPDLLAFQRRLVAQSGKPAVFFVGAGLSAICGLPLWHEALRVLSDYGASIGRISHEKKDLLDSMIDGTNYLECGSMLRQELGPRLEEKLSQMFGAPLPANLGAYEDLVRLPCAGFVTTNYDCLIEAAYTKHHGKPLRVISRQHRAGLADLAQGEAFIVRLHGDSSRNEFVISQEDYNAIHQDAGFMRILYALFFKYAFLFLGYGMSDNDILCPLRLIAQDLGTTAPRHVALMPSIASTAMRRELEDKAAINVVLYEDEQSHGCVEELPLRWLAEASDTGVNNPFLESPFDCTRLLQKSPDLVGTYLERVANKACDWLMTMETQWGLEPKSSPRAANLAEALTSFHTAQRVLDRPLPVKRAVETLLSFQDDSGGYLSHSFGAPTTHTTSLAAYALSLYEDLDPQVTEANERASAWLQANCNPETGGWGTFGRCGTTRIVPSIWGYLALSKLDGPVAETWGTFRQRLLSCGNLGYLLSDDAKSSTASGWMLWLLSFLRHRITWTDSEERIVKNCIKQLTAGSGRLVGEHEGFMIDEGGPRDKQGVWVRWIHTSAPAVAIGILQWLDADSDSLHILGAAVAHLAQQARVGSDGHLQDGTIEQSGATPFIFPTLYGLWALCEVTQWVKGALIDKIGLFVIRDGKVLLLRKRGTHQLIAPGGAIEAGETPKLALTREIREELGVGIADQSFLGVFEDAAAFEKGATVRITGYVGQLSEEPRPSAEIAECVWADSNYAADKLSPIIRRKVVPELKRRGFIT